MTVGSDAGAPAQTLPDLGEGLGALEAETWSPGRADRWSAVLLGGGFALVALISAGLGWGRVEQWAGGGASALLRLALLIGLYSLAFRTEFEAAHGSAVPTQPVLAAMLLTLPLPIVPLGVLAGQLLGSLGAHESPRFGHRLAVRSLSGWHCLGPVGVLWWFDSGPADLGNWWVYLLALAMQFVVDGVSSTLRARALGVRIETMIGPLAWTWGVDAMLAPVGLSAVIAADGSVWVVLLLLAPLGLVRLLALDRATHRDAAVSLGTAFEEVHAEARVDAMTGVANRRAWDEAIAEASNALPEHAGLVATVVMADLDYLKRTNDSAGHDAGDRLLRRAASTLVDASPAGALVARLGGDEFGVLAWDVPGSAVGELIIDRARSLMAADRDTIPLSMSLGAASCPPAASVTEAIMAADVASAADKASRRAGRDERPAPVRQLT